MHSLILFAIVMFYIDVINGNDDTGDGTKQKPFKSLLFVLQNKIDESWYGGLVLKLSNATSNYAGQHYITNIGATNYFILDRSITKNLNWLTFWEANPRQQEPRHM